jgi:hypothetical protein
MKDGKSGPNDHSQAEISINGDKYLTKKGMNTVAHLRELGHVPADEVLSQLKDGQLVDLSDDGHVQLHGGEEFASHIKTCASS